MKRLVEYVLDNGGMTYNPRNGSMPTEGYMVAIAQNEHIIDGQLTEGSLVGYMMAHTKTLQNDQNSHVGVWYNTEDGRTYLDTSYRFTDFDEAMAFARQNHQLAIFDLGQCEEIRLQVDRSSVTSRFSNCAYNALNQNEREMCNDDDDD